MNRDTEWHVFEKSIELTASAVRGTAGQGQEPAYVADVFREVLAALKAAAEEMPDKTGKAGF